MKITRSSHRHQQGPRRVVHRRRLPRRGRRPRPLRPGAACNLVHFTPGARTAWHTHALGQTLFVTEGVGLCQRDGGPIEVIRPGDRVFFEPGEEHWHGAAPNRFMVHLADQRGRRRPRSLAVWGDTVTDDEYAAAPRLAVLLTDLLDAGDGWSAVGGDVWAPAVVVAQVRGQGAVAGGGVGPFAAVGPFLFQVPQNLSSLPFQRGV